MLKCLIHIFWYLFTVFNTHGFQVLPFFLWNCLILFYLLDTD